MYLDISNDSKPLLVSLITTIKTYKMTISPTVSLAIIAVFRVVIKLALVIVILTIINYGVIE